MCSSDLAVDRVLSGRWGRRFERQRGPRQRGVVRGAAGWPANELRQRMLSWNSVPASHHLPSDIGRRAGMLLLDGIPTGGRSAIRLKVGCGKMRLKNAVRPSDHRLADGREITVECDACQDPGFRTAVGAAALPNTRKKSPARPNGVKFRTADPFRQWKPDS